MKKTLSILLMLCLFVQVSFAQIAAVKDLIEQGIKMHDKKNFSGAIESYKKALQIDKKSPWANYECASSYFAMKDYENCIKHCDNVIAANIDYVDQAYILKGSALDVTGKPQEAVIIYKRALQSFTGNYLLYYNLALTSFNLKDYKTTDDALQKVLKLNPSHNNSHYLLALSMINQGKRVKAILALYNFLLLEPLGGKAEAALQALDDEFKKGVKVEKDKNSTITIPDKKDEDFYTADLMLGLLESSTANETNKGKSETQLFVEKTESLFKILGESKKNNKGFWWNFYVDYFYSICENKFTEPFCQYIGQSRDSTYKKWVSDKKNLEKLEAFSTWYVKYERKF
jgi:tetratricopeptide (TPR) repeat protein